MTNPITSKNIRSFWSEMQRQVRSEPLYRQMAQINKLKIGLFCDTDLRIGMVIHSITPLTRAAKYTNFSLKQYRKGDQWEIVLKLLNTELEFTFSVLCSQIINGLNDSEITDGGKYISFHLERWYNLLAKSRQLTVEQERGLWTELHILEASVIKYGKTETLHSWVGPTGAPQDFCFEDNYVEVKSLMEKAGEIRISSLDQLNPVGNLYLVLVGIQQSSFGLTLKEKVQKLNKIFSDPDDQLLFKESLMMCGYSEEMEKTGSDRKYEVVSINWYDASSTEFPALRKSEINPAIIKANYVLSVALIERFRVERLF